MKTASALVSRANLTNAASASPSRTMSRLPMARKFPSNEANDPHKNVCRAAPVHRCSFFQSLTT